MVLASLAENFEGQTFDYRIDNPIGIEGLANVEMLPVFVVLGGIYAIGAVGAVASVAVRFRRSRGTERQQLKWFLYAAAPIVTVPVADSLPGVVSGLVFAWVLCGIPAAIGIAILKYRLYDIDRIINRTLVYGFLDRYARARLPRERCGLQRLFRRGGGGHQLAVVASTLAISGAASSLAPPVQALVDRRFYRASTMPGKMLAAFSARLRDEYGPRQARAGTCSGRCGKRCGLNMLVCGCERSRGQEARRGEPRERIGWSGRSRGLDVALALVLILLRRLLPSSTEGA